MKFELVDSNNTKFSFKVVVKRTILELCIILDTFPSNPDVLYLQEKWASKENEFYLLHYMIPSWSYASNGPKNVPVVQQSCSEVTSHI